MQIFLPELRDQVYIEINAVLVLGLGLHLTPKEFIVDVEHGAEQELRLGVEPRGEDTEYCFTEKMNLFWRLNLLLVSHPTSLLRSA